jgi:phosphoribosylamine--glycine ligase
MARRGGYVGSIDINCIVNEIGIYPLEFTPRFGYPTIALQEESLESPTRQFFHDLAHGLDPSPEVHNGYQVAVRVVLPPFPFDDEKTYDENSRNAAIVFDTPDGTTPEGVHIGDGKRVDGQWRAAGESGMPLVVTAKRETMAAAREQAYDRVDSVLLPNCYYRDDIGERWSDGDGDRLQAWGYLGP